MWYNFQRSGCSKNYQTPIGGNRIVCIYDCPTELEKNKQVPVMGITGSNLCLLFRILRSAPSQLNDEYGTDLYRRSVGIFNTAEDKRNININKKLKDVEDKLVLCFGAKAEKRLSKCTFSKKICVYHTAERGLMQIGHLDEVCECLKIPVAMRSVARLFVVAEYIVRRYAEIVKGIACIGTLTDFIKRFDSADCEEFADLLSNVINYNRPMVFSSECSFDCCIKCKQCKLVGKDFAA